jgi:hypothetical protein
VSNTSEDAVVIAKFQKAPKSRRFLSRQEQAERYGTSVKTIDRWGKDPRMNMPREFQFHRIMKRAEDELELWERGRVATCTAAE